MEVLRSVVESALPALVIITRTDSNQKGLVHRFGAHRHAFHVQDCKWKLNVL